MDEAFGSSLRRERELRFIELKEISQATMISLRFLEAIENDDFDSLPHSTFVRGFLRAYAKYVGLSPDEVVTNYEHYLQFIKGEEVPEQPEEKKHSINYIKLGIWAGALITLLVGGVLVYLALRGEGGPPTGLSPEHEAASRVFKPKLAVPITEGQEPVAVEPAVPAEDVPVTPAEKALPVTPPAKVDSPSPSLAKEGEGVELVLRAIEESWVLFQLDEQPESDIIMPAGTTKTLNAQSKIVLTVGNAAGVELMLNGEPLPPLGKPGQVVRKLVFEAKAEMEEKTIIQPRVIDP